MDSKTSDAQSLLDNAATEAVAGAHYHPPKPADPISKDGYYPLYINEADADASPDGDGSSHTHVLHGVTYYMPNGLTSENQYHGNYGHPVDGGSIGSMTIWLQDGKQFVHIDDNPNGR